MINIYIESFQKNSFLSVHTLHTKDLSNLAITTIAHLNTFLNSKIFTNFG